MSSLAVHSTDRFRNLSRACACTVRGRVIDMPVGMTACQYVSGHKNEQFG